MAIAIEIKDTGFVNQPVPINPVETSFVKTGTLEQLPDNPFLKNGFPPSIPEVKQIDK